MTQTEKKELNKLAKLIASKLSKLNKSYKQEINNLLNSTNEEIYLKNLETLIKQLDKAKPEHKALLESGCKIMSLSLSDYEDLITIAGIEYTMKAINKQSTIKNKKKWN